MIKNKIFINVNKYVKNYWIVKNMIVYIYVIKENAKNVMLWFLM